MKTVLNIIISLAVLGNYAFADSPAKLVREGNQAYQKEHYGEAMDKYDQAKKADETDSGHVSFNKGNCLFRQGKIDDAIEHFRDAANNSEDNNLASMSQFNLGNCFYNRALESEKENPQQAVDDYQQSARCYRKALDLNKKDTQAAENISLTRRKIKQLKELLEQQQQQSQDNKDNNQEGEEEKEEGSQNQQEQGQEQDKQQGDQQDKQQGNQDEQGQDQQQSQQEKKGEAENQENQGDQQQGQKQEGDEQDQQEAQQGEQGEPQQEIKKKVELDPRAAQLIEDEKKRREQILQILKAKQKPVEKDW